MVSEEGGSVVTVSEGETAVAEVEPFVVLFTWKEPPV